MSDNTNSNTAVAVVRDTVDGACYLVPTGRSGLDELLLNEAGPFELAGWLEHSEQAAARLPVELELSVSDGGQYKGPMFTNCEYSLCDRLIALKGDDSAPEFCTEHETMEAQ